MTPKLMFDPDDTSIQAAKTLKLMFDPDDQRWQSFKKTSLAAWYCPDMRRLKSRRALFLKHNNIPLIRIKIT